MKSVFRACLVLLLAVPAFAEDSSASIQNSMGYANLSFPDFATGLPTHHSGFANETDFNLSKTWGLNNYVGLYGLGQGGTLLSDFFGGKIMYKRGKVTPYALAGLGGGYFSTGYGSATAFGLRYGAGVTVPINGSLAWKVEYSRMNFHLPTTAASAWTGGNNISTGIVFTISN